MAIPDDFPRRMSRGTTATAATPAAEAPADGTPADPAADSPPPVPMSASVPAPGSVRWRRAALLLCLAAQLITISALVSVDPIPASWAALLLAIAPAPLAAAALLAPAPAARVAVVVTGVVVVVGIVGQITHTGLFFLPALAALVVAAVLLWREQP
jgi:hypothetical protein